jgi:hypothetical protein
LPAVETFGGGEVVVVAQEEEVFDELPVSHGEAELALQFLPGVFDRVLGPSPLPVREGAV